MEWLGRRRLCRHRRPRRRAGLRRLRLLLPVAGRGVRRGGLRRRRPVLSGRSGHSGRVFVAGGLWGRLRGSLPCEVHAGARLLLDVLQERPLRPEEPLHLSPAPARARESQLSTV